MAPRLGEHSKFRGNGPRNHALVSVVRQSVFSPYSVVAPCICERITDWVSSRRSGDRDPARSPNGCPVTPAPSRSIEKRAWRDIAGHFPQFDAIGLVRRCVRGYDCPRCYRRAPHLRAIEARRVVPWHRAPALAWCDLSTRWRS